MKAESFAIIHCAGMIGWTAVLLYFSHDQETCPVVTIKEVITHVLPLIIPLAASFRLVAGHVEFDTWHKIFTTYSILGIMSGCASVIHFFISMY